MFVYYSYFFYLSHNLIKKDRVPPKKGQGGTKVLKYFFSPKIDLSLEKMLAQKIYKNFFLL